MSSEKAKKKNREAQARWRKAHPDKVKEEGKKKRPWTRYVYPPCKEVDCDWVEAQLEAYRKETEDEADTDKHEAVHQEE
jgi:hypothetical protein